MHASDLVAWALMIAFFVLRGAVLIAIGYVIVAVVRGLLRPAEPGAAAPVGTTFSPGRPSADH